MKTELIITKDGSHSLFVPELNEIYHSTNGAIQESNHIFIQSGLAQIAKKEISILEIGFGTGLNAFLTLSYALKNNLKINYFTIEKYPVEKNIVEKLNYVELIDPAQKDTFQLLHNGAWNNSIKINQNFTFIKYQIDLNLFAPYFSYDVIFFDAFAPDVQPELWTKENFMKLYKNLNQGGNLTTYSAKGEVKRNLEACGFFVERIPGPPGKREIIRATKKP